MRVLERPSGSNGKLRDGIKALPDDIKESLLTHIPYPSSCCIVVLVCFGVGCILNMKKRGLIEVRKESIFSQSNIV